MRLNVAVQEQSPATSRCLVAVKLMFDKLSKVIQFVIKNIRTNTEVLFHRTLLGIEEFEDCAVITSERGHKFFQLLTQQLN